MRIRVLCVFRPNHDVFMHELTGEQRRTAESHVEKIDSFRGVGSTSAVNFGSNPSLSPPENEEKKTETSAGPRWAVSLTTIWQERNDKYQLSVLWFDFLIDYHCGM